MRHWVCLTLLSLNSLIVQSSFSCSLRSSTAMSPYTVGSVPGQYRWHLVWILINIKYNMQQKNCWAEVLMIGIVICKLITFDRKVGFQFWSDILKALIETLQMVYLVVYYLSGPQLPFLPLGPWVIAFVFFSKLANFWPYYFMMPTYRSHWELSDKLWIFVIAPS